MRPHEEVSDVKGESLSQLAVDFKTCLFGVRKFAIVPVHSTRTRPVTVKLTERWIAWADHELSGVLAGQENGPGLIRSYIANPELLQRNDLI